MTVEVGRGRRSLGLRLVDRRRRGLGLGLLCCFVVVAVLIFLVV